MAAVPDPMYMFKSGGKGQMAKEDVVRVAEPALTARTVRNTSPSPRLPLSHSLTHYPALLSPVLRPFLGLMIKSSDVCSSGRSEQSAIEEKDYRPGTPRLGRLSDLTPHAHQRVPGTVVTVANVLSDMRETRWNLAVACVILFAWSTSLPPIQ